MLKEAALELASQGVEVFPLDDQKKPRTKHGFHDASSDPAVVAKMPWDGAGAIGA